MSFRSTDGADSVRGETQVTAGSTVICPDTAELQIGMEGIFNESQVVWDGTQFVLFQRGVNASGFWHVSPDGLVEAAGPGPDSFPPSVPLIPGPTGSAWLVLSDAEQASPTRGVWLREATGSRVIKVNSVGRPVLGAAFNASTGQFAVLSLDTASPAAPSLLVSTVDSMGTAVDHALPLPAKAELVAGGLVSSGVGFEVFYDLSSSTGPFLTHVNAAGQFGAAVPLPPTLKFRLLHIARSPDAVAVLDVLGGLELRLYAADGTQKKLVHLDTATLPAALQWTGRGWLVAWARKTSAAVRLMTARLSPEGDVVQGPRVASCTTTGGLWSLGLALDDVHLQTALVWTASGPGLITTRMQLLPVSP